MRKQYLFYIADILLCLIASALFYKIATWHIEFAFYNGEYTPAFPDSFYHASRILEIIKTGNLLQFDPNFHAPAGAWVTWPWGYDWFIACIIKSVMSVTGMSAMKIMVHIPPVWAVINIGLLIYLCRELLIPFAYRIVVVSCFVLSPLNQQLHLIGRIDHHYMEMTMVLACLSFGLAWFNRIHSRSYPVALGFLLGMSMAIHNSLFILQLPILLSFILCWLCTKSLPSKTHYFCCSLFISSLIFLIPSETFRQGFFEFYYHSSFHLYISTCVSLIIYLISKHPFSRNNMFYLIVISILMLLPLGHKLILGYSYVSGEAGFLGTIGEVKSLFGFFSGQALTLNETITNYSGYILVLPLVGMYLLYRAIKIPQLSNIFLFVFFSMSIFFLLMQMRFHYFGSVMLYVPLALIFYEISKKIKKKGLPLLIFIFTSSIAYSLPVENLFKKQPVSNVFETVYWASKELEKECMSDPGIVLASAEMGHYLTYFTECTVIANSFGVTPEDYHYHEKLNLLFKKSAKELYLNESSIKYVLVLREDNIYMDLPDEEVSTLNSRLTKELIMVDVPPDNYNIIFEARYDISGKEITYARVLKLVR